MSVTTTALTRAAGAAAGAAGLVFIGVQVGHPHLDVASVDTPEVVGRDSLKVLMAVLALAGITGMYLRQVRRSGVLGLVGYVLFGAGYLSILSTSVVAASVLPALADDNPDYVSQVLFVANGGKGGAETGVDIGLLGTVFAVQGVLYLAGGLVFGVALYRARVLTRWAAALLAVSGPLSAALTVMPDAFYRLLALPNGIAMIALGWSLWRVALDATPAVPTADRHTVGAR